MASAGRNNKRGGGGNGGGGGGQPAAGQPRRSSWRGGPPGSSPGGNAGPGRAVSGQKQQDSTNGSTFRTDADISHASGPVQRELQPWGGAAAAATVPASPLNGGAGKDTETFGDGAHSGAWDQFAVNERLTGAKTDFDEELYTTKLNREGADFRKREKEAERLAKEIMTGATSNPHIAEERNQVTDDSGKDEEDKYSGVIRKPNAYVPPGARRSQIAPGIVQVGSPSPSAPAAAPLPKGVPTPLDVLAASLTMGRSNSNVPQSTEKADLPKVSVEEHDLNKEPPKNVVQVFKAFVDHDRERFERFETKKQVQAKSERSKQFAELVKFGQSFKVTHPLPKDILPILTKDEQKQKEIEARARAAPAPAPAPAQATSAISSPQQPKKIPMKIQEIPAFGAGMRKGSFGPKPPSIPVEGSAKQNIPQPQSVTSPTPSNAAIAAAKLNPKASTFVFKPSASTFTPKASDNQAAAGPSSAAASAVTSPAPSAAVPVNPFFQGQPIRRTNGINVRDDFNPWKHSKLADAASIAPAWPYSGKRFMTMFPAAGPMMMQPGSFEEEGMMGGPMPPNGSGGPGFNTGYPYQQYRFGGQPGMMQHMPMPGAGPYPPQFPGGMQGPNGPGPMYYNPGMPQGPQFMGGPPGSFSPNGPNRPGPGPGPGQAGPGPQHMYYAMQSPQLNHSSPFPSQPQQFQQQGPPPTPPQPPAQV